MPLVRVATDTLVYYRSPLLRDAGIPHAFSTRLGGVSPPPMDSLNLGSTLSPTLHDDPAHVRENYRRLQSAIGCADRELVHVHQVHGRTVANCRPGETFDCGQYADAIVSDDPTRVLSVRVADCVPILLADRAGRAVAAVHAGWRGIIAGAVPAAIGRLHESFGVLPMNLLAAIGPCIGPEAFEVGPEVVEQFITTFGNSALIRPGVGGKGYADLAGAVANQLFSAGLSPAQIDCSGRCTATNRGEFFSHRRDAGRTGRMAALIAPRRL